ncbi:phage head-binding domain-containing protein [Klebsiella aerogenes]|uniref:phage head-binding domain-containing protein n=1 Tax=Klebsiella aerogenes TaxID=548 RepID=UPI002DBA709C|nr:phage head-binding domain-containing protein [Klebsiella aerogenes]MEB6655015.1 phage head-binding domain-containing protein [Klebsiella aerogenes]
MSDITANVVVSMPNQLFTLARSFKAASGGKIYIGQIDTDPVNPANQIQVYLENEDGSHVPVAQPLIINAAGYPVYNGQIAKFVTVQGHSMAVYDMYGTQQFYYPNVLKYDPDQLRVELAGSGGAALVGVAGGGTVQDFIDGEQDRITELLGFVTPEMFGDTSDSSVRSDLIWQEACEYAVAHKKGVRGLPGRTYLFSGSCVIPYLDSPQLVIDGSGCTIKMNGAYPPFMQKLSDGSTSITTSYVDYLNITIRGAINKNTAWASATPARGLTFSNGTARNIKGYGLVNVISANGNTKSIDIYGDDLRNSLYSCYPPGNNEIRNYAVGWCSGDMLVLKGTGCRAINGKYEYAGCIDVANEDGADALRGAAISTGADGIVTSDVYICGLTGKFYGAGGLNLNGDNHVVDGGIDIGSIYTGNLNVTLPNTPSAFLYNVRNSYIGEVRAGTTWKGVGVNANSRNSFIGRAYIDSKLGIAGSTLFSVTDSGTATITGLHMGGVSFNGQSTINDDVYINTEGVTIDSISIAALNNQQGGNTVTISRAARIKNMYLSATTSASENNVVIINSDAVIENLTVRRVFGSALVVSATANPKIFNLNIFEKQGTIEPIKILGTTGNESRSFGNVRITGASSGRPSVVGTISMLGYAGTAWKKGDASLHGITIFPTMTSTTL